MSIVTQDQLKAYFQTGLVPTQSNFADLIDSTFNRAGGLTYAGNLNQPLQGTVSTTTNSATLTGVGTAFQSQLWEGAGLRIGTLMCVVQSIATDTQLTLTQPVTSAISNVSAYTENVLLSIENYLNDALLTLSPRGRLGIGTATPGSALDVAGIVTAQGFAGSGAALTGIVMDNISGTLPATRLSGVLAAAQLPAINASNLVGTLALAQIPDLSARSVFFHSSTPCINSGDSVTLNWLADPAYDLVLTYVSDTGVVNTHFQTTSPTQSGTTSITLTTTTVFTLTASNNNVVVAQHQLQVTVAAAPPLSPSDYVKALKAKGMLIQNIIPQCVGKYGLDTLNVTHISSLAQALEDAGFDAASIYQSVEQYYGFKASDSSSIPYMESLIKILGPP